MRFGEVAIEKGYIDREELDAVLMEQDRILREDQVSRFVGELLVERGAMTEKQVLDVLNKLHARRPVT